MSIVLLYCKQRLFCRNPSINLFEEFLKDAAREPPTPYYKEGDEERDGGILAPNDLSEPSPCQCHECKKPAVCTNNSNSVTVASSSTTASTNAATGDKSHNIITVSDGSGSTAAAAAAASNTVSNTLRMSVCIYFVYTMYVCVCVDIRLLIVLFAPIADVQRCTKLIPQSINSAVRDCCQAP